MLVTGGIEKIRGAMFDNEVVQGCKRKKGRHMGSEGGCGEKGSRKVVTKGLDSIGRIKITVAGGKLCTLETKNKERKNMRKNSII